MRKLFRIIAIWAVTFLIVLFFESFSLGISPAHADEGPCHGYICPTFTTTVTAPPVTETSTTTATETKTATQTVTSTATKTETQTATQTVTLPGKTVTLPPATETSTTTVTLPGKTITLPAVTVTKTVTTTAQGPTTTVTKPGSTQTETVTSTAVSTTTAPGKAHTVTTTAKGPTTTAIKNHTQTHVVFTPGSGGTGSSGITSTSLWRHVAWAAGIAFGVVLVSLFFLSDWARNGGQKKGARLA